MRVQQYVPKPLSSAQVRESHKEKISIRLK